MIITYLHIYYASTMHHMHHNASYMHIIITIGTLSFLSDVWTHPRWSVLRVGVMTKLNV